MSTQFILYLLAAVAFMGGVIDHPKFSAIRCISLGLMFITLALLVPLR